MYRKLEYIQMYDLQMTRAKSFYKVEKLENFRIFKTNKE